MKTKNSAFPRGRSAWWRAALALSIAATHVGTADAEEPERAKARELGYSGVEAYVANDFVTANIELDEAYRLVPMPSLGLWSARTLVKLGRWIEAAERYRSVSTLSVNTLSVSASDSEVQRKAQEDAAREHESLLAEMPSVLIELSNAAASEVRASLDGVPIDPARIGRDLWVNPGRHVVSGGRGSETVEQAFAISANERKQILLRFAAVSIDAGPAHASSVAARRDTAPASSLNGTLRATGWVALAAGGAGLVTGSFAYWMARRHYTTLQRQNWCASDACDRSAVDAYNTWRTVHLTGLIAGGVLSAAGLGLLIATPSGSGDADPRTTITLRLDAQTLTLGGYF